MDRLADRRAAAALLPRRHGLAWALPWLLACGSVQAMDLGQIIETTLRSHPAVQAQRALQDSAEVDVRTARQQFLPTPSVAVENVRSASSDPLYRGDATVQTLRLQQPLWTGGRLTAGLDKAQANLRAAQHAQDDAAQQLALRAVQAWAEWHVAHLKLIALQAGVSTHERLYEQVQRRVENGASSAVEVELTAGRLAQIRAQFQAVQAQLRAARLKVAQLTGAPISEDQVPSQRLQFEAPSMALLEEQALERSPAIQRQLALSVAQQAERAERRAELWPEVFLRAERQNSRYDNPAMASSTSPRYVIGLNSRFGAGLSSLTALESFEKRMEATLAELESSRRNLREQVQSEWEQWRSFEQRLPALQRNLQAARATAQAWDRQFLAGRKSWLEVMNTTRELLQAELELAEAQSAQIQLSWRLALLSRGWQETLQAAVPAPTSASSAPVRP